MPQLLQPPWGKGLSRADLVHISLPTRRAAVTPRYLPRKPAKTWIMRGAPRARLFLDELAIFPKPELTDKMNSIQFINWVQHSLGWTRHQREEMDKIRRDRVEPIR